MMTNAQLAAASFNDIVFDGRNKGYGAYELRALYQRHVSRALVIASTIFVLLISFPLVAAYLKGPVELAPPKRIVEIITITPPVTPDEVIMPPPPVTPVRPVPPPPPAATARYMAFKVERDEKVTETPPNVEDLRDRRIGTENIDVPETGKPDLEAIEPVETPSVTSEAVKPAAPYTYVEQMPELPGGGGVAAIVNAIQKAVRYPGRAISNGIEGKLYASFVVNAQGEVVDVKIVKGLGYGLDEESIRAIKTLPRFIPGKQNGREVSVQYTVPITYKIQ